MVSHMSRCNGVPCRASGGCCCVNLRLSRSGVGCYCSLSCLSNRNFASRPRSCLSYCIKGALIAIILPHFGKHMFGALRGPECQQSMIRHAKRAAAVLSDKSLVSHESDLFGSIRTD